MNQQERHFDDLLTQLEQAEKEQRLLDERKKKILEQFEAESQRRRKVLNRFGFPRP